MKYSISKGVWKGLQGVLTMALTVLVVTGLSEVTIWDLVVKYIQPLLGTLTVGFVMTMVINFIKVKAK